MCNFNRATTFIKLKKQVKNANFELHIEKLQKSDPTRFTKSEIKI